MDHNAHHDHHGHEPHPVKPAGTEPATAAHRHPPAHAEEAVGGHGGHGGGHHDKHAGHSPAMFRNRFWLSLLLTLPILYFDPHFQTWFGYEAADVPMAKWITPVLAIVLYFYGGWVFVAGARHELMARQPGMMTLISLAITVAFVYSVAVTLGFPGMAIYWELATLIVIMLLGHWIEMASVQGASRALEHLASLVPDTAQRLVDGRVEEVAVAALRNADRVLIRPGAQVPADGTVLEGRSSVNEAFLTGESRPVPKAEGDSVVAGAVNGEGALTIAVARTGDETTLSQIQRLVSEAQASRSRFQNLADRAAFYLTIVAIVAGTLTLGAWLFLGFAVDFAIIRAVTVLVIACPHALGLAIPLVTVNATSISARNGILVRNREAFERARDLTHVAFDKTGTLTEGRFGVRKIYVSQREEDEMLRIAASLEARSEHPLGRAVVEASEARRLPIQEVSAFEVHAGRGVSGLLGGIQYRIGRPEWVAEHGLRLGPGLSEGLEEAESRGESVIAMMDEEGPLALFALEDQVRPGARRAVTALKDMGIEPVMITGDAQAVAATVAAALGITSYHARVLPEKKADHVRTLRETGRVAFVGDGINDAPALLEADLGIAIGAGTDVAIESADLVLIEDDPEDVVRALTLSRATYRKMIQNLFWATGYNAVAIPLAAGVAYGIGVLLSPAIGAILMSASTVIVAVNAVLLRRTRL